MKTNQTAAEALDRAQSGVSVANYRAIFEGFMERGIAQADILPRENVLTFDAWRALGRHVRRGEHGVRVSTWIPVTKKETDEETGAEGKVAFKRAKTVSVFHISQTDADEVKS